MTRETLTPLSALTLTQMWAMATVAKDLTTGRVPKLHETRSWKSNLRPPFRLAIHAGKGHARLRRYLITNRGLFIGRYAMVLCGMGYSTVDPWATPERRATIVDEWNGARIIDGHTIKPLPLSAIVGLVTVTGFVRTERVETTTTDQILGDYTSGRWAWRFDDPWECPTPVPCAGAQSLWTVPPDVAAQVRAHGGMW